MEEVVLDLLVHQPYRIRKFRVFDIGKEGIDYFDDDTNRSIFSSLANEIYFDINKHLIRLLDLGGVRFRISISGLALEQMVRYAPKLLESFDELFANKNVEVLVVPYYNTPRIMMSSGEVKAQLEKNKDVILKYFNVEPNEVSDKHFFYDEDLLNLIESVKDVNGLKEIFEKLNLVEHHVSKDHFFSDLNELQKDALMKFYNIEQNLKLFGNEYMLEDWRKLSTHDFIHYMSTKPHNLGENSKSAYDSPYDSYLYFMNVLNDLTYKLNLKKIEREKNKMLDKDNYETLESVKKEIF